MSHRIRNPSVLALLLAVTPAGAQRPACTPGNGGLTLPRGFCAAVVLTTADSLPGVRHLAVAPNGDVFAARRGRSGGVVVLRDTNGDGKADVIGKFFEGASGSGIALGADAVYFSTGDRVLRFPWKPGDLTPSGPPETIATGLPTGGHGEKGIVLGRDGALFVSFGSLTNSCQKAPEEDRKGPFAAPNPCPELAQRAGVWRFDSRKLNQTPADGRRWATGLRNPMAVSIDPATGFLYAAAHGRDNLTENWGWPAEQGRENPAETFYALPEGADGGWPYCFYDTSRNVMLQNPEYGGDGQKPGDCAGRTQPIFAFPAHWAPNATVFYRGTQFPAAYRGGVFVAFHGSWNRAPAPQEGFRVTFTPMRDGRPAGPNEMFALPSGAPTSIRPSGLAVGPDGSLYISADMPGAIWRVMYTGN